MSIPTGHAASDVEAHGVMRDVRNLFGAALVGGVAVAVLQQMAQSLLGPAIGMAAAASFASSLSSASHGRLVHQHSIPFLAIFVVVGTPVVYLAMWLIHRGMMLMM
ncbi:MAG TPA: hypothetical protein VIF83_01495 [Gemmatimonadaceae bacterium]|jgi:hypothetical protein